MLDVYEEKGAKKMKKDSVEMVFILDRSGSMAGLESDTIGGFNALIEKQKNTPGEAIVSTVLFDHEFEVVHNRKPLHDVKPMTGKEYYVRGTTALLDAIGKSILKMVSVYKKLKSDEKPEKTMFIITTDGRENASKEFGRSQIKNLIEYQKEHYDWEFIFLGANIDAISTARDYGIREDRVANYHSDHRGTELNYEVLSEFVSDFRIHKSIKSDWKDKIDEDYHKRKK
jgi:uncharacterized protein YegL